MMRHNSGRAIYGAYGRISWCHCEDCEGARTERVRAGNRAIGRAYKAGYGSDDISDGRVPDYIYEGKSSKRNKRKKRDDKGDRQMGDRNANVLKVAINAMLPEE